MRAIDMTHSMHSNSLTAFWQMRDAGELEPKELRVLEALAQFGPMTRNEISERSGMPINCVTGRCRSLCEKHVIAENGSKINPTSGKPNAILHLKVSQLDLLEMA